MNIVLIIVDTLRYDYIHANGRLGWIQTPNLDRLASRSLVFDRAYAASYPTIPHRTDVMTGRYGEPFHPWQPLRFDVPTLPMLLYKEGGYCTQLIHSTPHLVNGGHAFDYPFNAWTPVRGAEVDRPWIDDRPLTHLANWQHDPLFDGLGLPEEEAELDWVRVTYTRANRRRSELADWSTGQLFARAGDFLRDNRERRNFFLWLDCFDPHPPYDAPAELVRLYDQTPGYDGKVDPRTFLLSTACRDLVPSLPDAALRRLRAYYAGMVTAVDLGIGRFLDALEETGLDRHTAIVLTADHGTCMGEYGSIVKHPSGGTLKEWESHVPLMVAVPEGPTGRSDLVVQPQDITRLILGLAGVTPPACDGYDPLSMAASGRPWPRELALSGSALNSWHGNPEETVFTVNDGYWLLNAGARPDCCRLYRPGATGYHEDVSSQYPEVVTELRGAGIAELERRGLPAPLVEWLQREGDGPFPAGAAVARHLAGWEAYFQHTYDRWK